MVSVSGLVVEIKCPYCTKDSDPELSTFLSDGSLVSSHQYYYQVQTQMLACNVEFADFVVCTFPNDKPTFYIERIEVDSDFLANCIMKSGDFYKIGIIPELLGRWFIRSTVLPTSTVDDSNDSQYVYCYCKEVKRSTVTMMINVHMESGSILAEKFRKWACHYLCNLIIT